MKIKSKNPETKPRELRTGFIGTGFIAEVHARVLARIAGARLTGVFDTDATRASSFAHRHGAQYVCNSIAELSELVDVVHILAPPPFHAKHAIQCLERGLDVLIEKPIATSTAECRQIAAAALASNSHVGVNHNATCFPAFRSAVEQIRRRRFGELQHVTVVVNVGLRQLSKGEHRHWMFRKPENLLLEQAPHPLSQILFLLGKVKSASALPAGEVVLNTGVRLYDTWQISLVCERGTAQCFISLGREYGDVWLQLIGQDATAFVDLRRNTFRISEKSRFMEPLDFFLDSFRNAGRTASQAGRNLTDYVLGFVGLRPPGDPFCESMWASIGGFYDSLRANQHAPTSLEEGTAVIEAYEQIVAGAESILNQNKTARTIYA